MRNIFVLTFFTLISLSLGVNAQSQQYVCPMHPTVMSDKPGKCPKCGMSLEKKPTGKMEQMSGMAHQQGGRSTKSTLNLSAIKTIKTSAPPKKVTYHLYVADTLVTFGKKQKRAIAVNGQIPMPTLTFTQGDTAEIIVHNNLDEETALHWHGMIVPNNQDGVPYLTQMPIKPHSTYTYRFPVVQSGTHWYHSHSGLQEQIGMYGSMELKKRDELDISTISVMLSEWTDKNPKLVDRLLHNASDWFSIQKGSTQSYAEAIKTGNFGTKVANEWKRMAAMDVSDVYYDAFLINGQNQLKHPEFKKGDKVRLRIANGGASSYFWLSYAGGKITVVGSDGQDQQPVDVDRLIIGTSETYDVIVTIPEDKQYEFLVTPEDRTKHASLWLGSGDKIEATKLGRLDYFAGMKMMNGMMKLNGDTKEMGMKMQNQQMDMNSVMYPELKAKDSQMDMGNMKMASSPLVTLNYGMLKAHYKSSLPNNPTRTVSFELTGNMSRYVWTMDNKTISESDRIMVNRGENLRIILYNNSMMRHPMHLHGHDFRILNKHGDYSPLKNVLDIMPMERDTIEFEANMSGDWFFHCHILYHMMSGMGRVVSYRNSPPNPELADTALVKRMFRKDDRMFHLMAENDFASNGNDGMLMVANTRWNISTEWRLGYNDMHGYETETHVGRYIGRMQWLMPFVGFDWRYRKMGHDFREKNIFGQSNTKDKRALASIGVQYTLPMLFQLSTEVYHNGNVRVQLMREDIPVSKRMRASLMVNSDKEYMGGLKYILTRNLALSTHYDSDMGWGGGLTLNY